RYKALRECACGRGVLLREGPMLDVSHGSWPRKGEWARSVGYWPEIDRPRTRAGARKPDVPNGHPHDTGLPELGLLSGRGVAGCERQAARGPNLAWFRSRSRRT